MSSSANGSNGTGKTGTWTVKTGLAQMLKGGVIMDVVTADHARIAEEAGAVAVMALERVPADIRATGGVAPVAEAALAAEERAPGRDLFGWKCLWRRSLRWTLRCRARRAATALAAAATGLAAACTAGAASARGGRRLGGSCGGRGSGSRCLGRRRGLALQPDGQREAHDHHGRNGVDASPSSDARMIFPVTRSGKLSQPLHVGRSVPQGRRLGCPGSRFEGSRLDD